MSDKQTLKNVISKQNEIIKKFNSLLNELDKQLRKLDVKPIKRRKAVQKSK